MNNENNELSDIVLNKNSSSGSSKKMLLAIATLGIVLIAVVTLMKSCGSESTTATPQGVIPPKPATPTEVATATEDATAQDTQEPLFEEVEVVQDDAVNDEDLDKIAKKLKEESNTPQTKPATKPKESTKPKQVVHSQSKPVHHQTISGVHYYIQVGSFTRYEPNKKFLASIIKLGYSYTYHKVSINGKTLNKVLVGPFSTERKARDARRVLRAKVEPGAFLVKLK